jgi:hypothetical protein
MSFAKPMNKPSASYEPKHSSNVMQQLSDSDYEEERRSKPILLYTGHTSPDGYGYIEDHEDDELEGYESDYEPPLSYSSTAMAMNMSDNASDDASYAEEDTEYISDEEDDFV